MHWFFVTVTWLSLVGLRTQEIPVKDEAACERMKTRILANWEAQEPPEEFGGLLGDCQYGKGNEI